MMSSNERSVNEEMRNMNCIDMKPMDPTKDIYTNLDTFLKYMNRIILDYIRAACRHYAQLNARKQHSMYTIHRL